MLRWFILSLGFGYSICNILDMTEKNVVGYLEPVEGPLKILGLFSFLRILFLRL